MSLLQLLGFKCSHPRLSRPMGSHGDYYRSCTTCGHRVPHSGWQVGASERGQVPHLYRFTGAIKRIGTVVQFRKRKEQSK